MEPAPFLSDIAEGPEGGRAYWLRAADETRIRVGVWPEGPKGTILMFPGRTEYIEKYGRVAAEFAARGYGMVAVDWRGCGVAAAGVSRSQPAKAVFPVGPFHGRGDRPARAL